MKRILCWLTLLSISTTINAQIFPGYRSSNYNGVNGVFFNPANIADNRFKWSVNLFAANVFIGNNQSRLGFKDIGKSFKADSLKARLLNGDKPNIKSLINADVVGPSFMISTKKGSAFALTSRSRVFSNVSGIDGSLAKGIIDGGASGNAIYPQGFSSYPNSKFNTVGWTELGASYAQVLTKKNSPHFFKAGITLKYLAGTTNTYISFQNLNGTVNDGVNGTFLTSTTGTVAINTTGADFNNYKYRDFFKFSGHGLGGEVGFVYEFRPTSMTNADTIYIDNHFANKYKLKIGIAVTDIGHIRFNKDNTTSATYNVNIPAGQAFLLNQFNDQSINQYKRILDNSPYFTQINSQDSKYNVTLPSTLRADIDYNIMGGFYAGLNAQVAITKNNGKLSLYNYNSISLTPRYETRFFSVAVPFNYNQLTNFNAGLSVRVGPVFFGSGTLFTAMFGKSKQADAHVGVTFGMPYKKKMRPDTDKDGVFDNIDACPTVAGPKMYNGCPDTDGDGIIDMNDKCPAVAGLARYEGCPIPDTDGDGINDEDDKCPTVAGIAKYQGCPIPDTDGDGINDEEDKCPTVVGTAKYQGCPVPDTDGDGVNDEDDKCPTRPGSVSNQGCPVIAKEIIEKINFAAKNIFFSTGSSKLLPKSFKSLNSVASLLASDKSLMITIDGHTDNTGKVEKNQQLSQDRAASVKAYLVSKGMEESRASVNGYGDTKPIADNKTVAGRAKNRRTEMTVRNF
ncbi:MAG: DUF5723 family protein [Ferruginibacter sp.]